MKSIFLTVVLSMVSTTVLHSQDYKPIRVALGGGVVSPQGSRGEPGWVASLEPGFRLSNNFLIGLKAETSMFTRGLSRNLTVTNPPTQITSGSVFAQYYLSPNYVRPFVSGGVGYSRISNRELRVLFNGNSQRLMIGKDQLSFMARAGIEVWHLSAFAELTFSGDEKPTDYLEIKNAYASLRFMFSIGGGLR